MAQCMCKLDQLRVQAAAVLIEVVNCKTRPALEKVGNVEKLVIPEGIDKAMGAFRNAVTSFNQFLQVDVSLWDTEGKRDHGLNKDFGSQATSWLRFLCMELRSIWEATIERMIKNVINLFPDDYWYYTVENRDETKIKDHICNNPLLDGLLPSSQAVKQAKSVLAKIISEFGIGVQLSDAVGKKCVEVEEKAKVLLGIRAASTVTLIRLPQATTLKSKQGYLRECKRLVKALAISLPTSVCNALESAAAS